MSTAMESLIAHTILQGFDAMYGRFLDVTAEAQERFEEAVMGTSSSCSKKADQFL